MQFAEYTNTKVIEYFSKKKHVSIEYSEALFQRLKEFLYKSSISDEPLSPSVEIDEIWHAFILHTEDYSIFCIKNFGKYIHHRPKNSSSDCDAVTTMQTQIADCDSISGDEGPTL